MQKVIVFIDWFYPAFKAGGPIKSIFNISQLLGDRFEFLIITSNIDLDGAELAVETNQRVKKDGLSVVYFDSKHQKKSEYLRIVNSFQPDFIYYNSLFSIKFTLLPYFLFKNRRGVINILAPRGMLGQGALSIKPLKKKLFLFITRNFLFNTQLIWHASTEKEQKEIQDQYGADKKVRIAQNIAGAILERDVKSTLKIKEQLKLVFLSRISSKKNLIFLLNIIEELKELNGISLDIYGPIEKDVDWQSYSKIIENDARIKYLGTVAPMDIAKKLQNYHVYTLPTLNENYGHSIVEAFLCGVPVLISDQTPWQELHTNGVGYDISLSDKENWKRAIKSFYHMNNEDYIENVQACYSYSKKNILNEQIEEENIKLFR